MPEVLVAPDSIGEGVNALGDARRGRRPDNGRDAISSSRARGSASIASRVADDPVPTEHEPSERVVRRRAPAAAGLGGRR
jgi:hypothetical protein